MIDGGNATSFLCWPAWPAASKSAVPAARGFTAITSTLHNYFVFSDPITVTFSTPHNLNQTRGTVCCLMSLACQSPSPSPPLPSPPPPPPPSSQQVLAVRHSPLWLCALAVVLACVVVVTLAPEARMHYQWACLHVLRVLISGWYAWCYGCQHATPELCLL